MSSECTCAYRLKLSRTAWFTLLLSGFHNPQGNDICSSFLSIPSGSLSFINVLIYLPVLSPHLDQFLPLADLVAAKHLALTLMQPHEGRIGLSDRRIQIYRYTFGFCH